MKAICVVGLGFGDEGKGSIVDALTRKHKADLVVRFNGGAQAAHHVVTDDGLEHCFAQFGSGTLAGARTHLSRFMLIDPTALDREAEHLRAIGLPAPYAALTIDPNAPIITPYHRALNRLREVARGANRHGSCGVGIGELASDVAEGYEVLTAEELFGDPFACSRQVTRAQDRLLDDARRHIVYAPTANIDDALALMKVLERPPHGWLAACTHLKDKVKLSDAFEGECVIFEGAQGVLLDEKYGFAPHTTWSNCTFHHAQALLNEMRFTGEVERIGVTRTYATRHGAGPFPTEDATLPMPVGEHNMAGPWQGNFRLGRLDVPLLEYAVQSLGGIDQIALTCVDHVGKQVAVHLSTECDPLRVNTSATLSVDDLMQVLETRLGAPVAIVSRGPTATDKEFR